MRVFLSPLIFALVLARAQALEPPFLRVGMPVEPTTVHWIENQTSADHFISTFLMRGMTRKSPAVCDLCEKIDKSTDGLSLRFHLQKIKWSDGVALKSQDFLTPLNALSAIAKISAPTPTQVLIELKKPHPTLLELLSQPQFFPRRSGAGQPPTLGPYIVAEWEKNERLVLEGNPEYTASRPVYRVEFYFGSREQQLARMKSGKLDVFSGPTTEEALKVPHTKVQLNPYLAVRALVPSFRSEKLKDITVRKALAMGLNRKAIQQFLKNGERIATSLLPSSIPGHREIMTLGEDLAAAKKGIPEKLELKVFAEDRYEETLFFRWLEECWTRLGIKLQRITSRDQAYDIALINFEMQSSLPEDLFQCFKSNARCNFGNWSNVGYDATLESLKQKSSEGELLATYEKLAYFLESQEVAVIPVTYPVKAYLLGPRVTRFSTTPFGMPDLLQIVLRK